jgi:hypothetical protein
LSTASQLYRPLQQTTIHVRSDQPFAELAKSSLRERGLLRAEVIEHHLPAQIDDGHLDGVGVGDPGVPLKQGGHGHHRGWQRVCASARAPVHGFQLRLERVIEQLVPVLAQKGEQLPRLSGALQQELLPLRGLTPRIPANKLHRCLRTAARNHGGSGRSNGVGV